MTPCTTLDKLPYLIQCKNVKKGLSLPSIKGLPFDFVATRCGVSGEAANELQCDRIFRADVLRVLPVVHVPVLF